MTISFFDGHNDVLLRLLKDYPGRPAEAFVQGNASTQLDLPRAIEAGFSGGLFATFAPSPERFELEDYQSEQGYCVPMPPPLPCEAAYSATIKMFDLLEQIELRSEGKLRICRNVAEIESARLNGEIAAVMHIEGADCIDVEFTMLDKLVDRGLRSVGLVWSRNNIFASGVPFKFPATPDIGAGLSEHGMALVEECNRRKLLIDLSHLNEKGFWDVAQLSTAPLVATHSNAYELCRSPRNLTDLQLKAVAQSGGIVGINFAPCFVDGIGMLETSVPMEAIVAQILYLLDHLGDDGIALGSDFDGVVMPDAIGDVTGVSAVFAALLDSGLPQQTLEKLASLNWMRILNQTIG